MLHNTTKRALKSLLLASSLALVSSQAFAVPIVFFGENLNPGGGVSGAPVTARNAFLAGLSGGVGTEDFEGLATGGAAGTVLNFPGSTGGIQATLSGSGAGQIANSPGAGRYATSGSQFLQSVRSGFTITFSSEIAAFGFYGTDIGDFGGQLILTLTNGGTDTITVNNSTNAPNGSLLFFGFIDTANTYSSITFANTSGTDQFGFDDMTIGDAQQVIIGVAEPTTLAILGLGLVGLGASRLRRS